MNKIILVKDDLNLKVLCCGKKIEILSIDYLNPEEADILHDQTNCKRIPVAGKLKKKTT